LRPARRPRHRLTAPRTQKPLGRRWAQHWVQAGVAGGPIIHAGLPGRPGALRSEGQPSARRSLDVVRSPRSPSGWGWTNQNPVGVLADVSGSPGNGVLTRGNLAGLGRERRPLPDRRVVDNRSKDLRLPRMYDPASGPGVESLQSALATALAGQREPADLRGNKPKRQHLSRLSGIQRVPADSALAGPRSGVAIDATGRSKPGRRISTRQVCPRANRKDARRPAPVMEGRNRTDHDGERTPSTPPAAGKFPAGVFSANRADRWRPLRQLTN